MLLIIDLQEKLMPAIQNSVAVFAQAAKLAEAANLLAIPIVVSEQVPEKLGVTVQPVIQHCKQAAVFSKTAFSALGDEVIKQHVLASKPQVLTICGVESHVCVAQTVEDALACGLTVNLITDATGSRHHHDYDMAIQRLANAGARLHTVESQLFAWMKDATHPKFKQVQALIK
jgi:nicotinamidase-related amidase